MLWDCEDTNVLALFDSGNIYVYIYRPVTIHGPEVKLLCTQTKNSGFSPIALASGTLTGQLKNGTLEHVMLDSHRPLQVLSPVALLHPVLLPCWSCGSWLIDYRFSSYTVKAQDGCMKDEGVAKICNGCA